MQKKMWDKEQMLQTIGKAEKIFPELKSALRPVREVIENPLRLYCQDEAVYRLSEDLDVDVESALSDGTLTEDDISTIADALYQSEKYVDNDVARNIVTTTWYSTQQKKKESFLRAAGKIGGSVLEQIGDGYTVTVREYCKNNKNVLAVSCGREGSPVFANIDILPDLRKGKKEEDIARAVVSKLRQAMADESLPDTMTAFANMDAEKLRGFILSNVRPVLVSLDNAGFLKDKVYRPYLDMAIVYYTIQEDWAMAVPKSAGIPMEELCAAARKNAAEAYQVLPFDCLIPESGLHVGHPLKYVVLSRDSVYGAAAMLDKGLMEEISGMMGGDFYILPSSVHECIVAEIQDDSDYLPYLRQIVYDINRSEVAPEERLTDSVYLYDAGTGAVRIAE